MVTDVKQICICYHHSLFACKGMHDNGMFVGGLLVELSQSLMRRDL